MALRRFQYVPCSNIPYLNMYDVGDVIFMMKRSWIICPPSCSSETTSGINPAGMITGSYSDANSVAHGFVRSN
jgi:hypothetical protein